MMATAFSLTGSIRFVPRLIDTLAATEVTDTATASIALGLADGTAAGAANGYWRDVVTVAPGASTSIDLRALPLIAFGGTGTLSLATVKALLIVNSSESEGVSINASGSNLWAGYITGSAAIGAQAVWLASNPGAGWPTTTTSRTVTIANAAQSVSLTGNLASASATVAALSSTAALRVGLAVSGTGIPAGTTVAAINSATSITLSAAATANATGGALTFTNPPAVLQLYIVGVKV